MPRQALILPFQLSLLKGTFKSKSAGSDVSISYLLCYYTYYNKKRISYQLDSKIIFKTDSRALSAKRFEMEVNMMHLETDRLLIRSLQPSDEKAFVEMASDGSLTEIFGDCSECHKWMGNFIKEAMRLELENDPNKEYLAYAVEDKSTHTVIGSVGTSYYEDFRQIGVTYFIGAKFRGCGYAAEALCAFAGYFLTNYPIGRLMAAANAMNKASCKTLERAGFQLVNVRPYRDMYDTQEELFHFYEIRQKFSTV